ncbi:MFS transporter [Archangium violaceum]|uniref:MFS transporter n=1 Tax=Archangium violaceum TaxID=83451 RepID=UPI002B312E9E|nr:MFS transporter [Archangium violaceum]
MSDSLSPAPVLAAPRPRPALLALAYLAFVSLGLPDAVLGIAWPSIRGAFALPQAALGAVLATSAAAYFLSGLRAGQLIRSLGIGTLLTVSTGLVTLGIAGFSLAPAFAWFLLSACFIGVGSGGIDAGLNTYAARHFGARHMTWLHAAYSTGAALGPVLLTAILARGGGWRAGYVTIGAVLGLLAVSFAVMRRQWGGEQARSGAGEASDASGPAAGDGVTPSISTGATLLRPRVWLQIFLFFFYSGVEVTTGQWSYTFLTESRGIDTTVAGTWVSLYWGSLLAGRVLLGFIVERVGSVRLLRLCSGTAILGAILFAIPGIPAAIGLAIIGFSLAPIFPGLMSETPRRIGVEAAAHAVGFQVSAATLGVATLPSLAGLLSERFGLEVVAPMIAICAVLFTVLHEVLVAVSDRGTTAPAR